MEQLVTLIGPSLTRPGDAVSISQLFFVDTVEFSEKATAQLKQEGSAAENQQLTEASAQQTNDK